MISEEQTNRPGPSPMVYFFFFLSGITALVYEIIWTRQLTLVFGHTVYSVSIVLAAFMAGLGFGSYLWGHLVDSYVQGDISEESASSGGNGHLPPRQGAAVLRLYALIEIGIFLTAGVMSLVFAEFHVAYTWLHAYLPESPELFNFIKAVLAFGLMFIPTTLMGATLPIISRYCVENDQDLGGRIGFLYALNTLGAAFGCILTGFFLIALWGVLETALAAAVTNLVIGIGCLRIYQDSAKEGDVQWRWPKLKLPETKVSPDQKLWMSISFACGFTALAYEVLWTRLLVFSIASTVYSFSLMLGVFLLGICIGSGIVAFLNKRMKDVRLVLMILQGAVGFYVVFSLFNMESLLSPPWNSYNLTDPVKAFGKYFRDSAALMLVPTILLGMNLPLLIRMTAGSASQLGRSTGQIYAANTFGAIAGSLVAGFVLLPLLGTEVSLLLVAMINLLIMPVLYRTGNYATPAVRRAVTVVMTAGILALNVAMPTGLLTQFFMRDSAGARDLSKLLHFEEGLTDTVAVFEDNYGILDPTAKRLITNGISMSASNLIATRYMKLFAHVPILLSDSPDEVLVICFGTGQTTGAAGVQPRVKSVDAVELSASVIGAADAFREENHDVVNNPKVHFILQDGRNHLLTTKKQYDIITGEPPPPRTAFTVNLYTKDFYEQAKRRMKPGGLMVQWVPLHSQSAREVDMHFSTFLSVFPHAIAWMSVANEIMLLGSDQPIEIDYKKLEERMQEPVVKKLMSDIQIESPNALLANIWFLEKEMLSLSENLPVITDNRPLIEFYLNQGGVIGTPSLERLMFNRSPFTAVKQRIHNMPDENVEVFKKYYEVMDLYMRGVVYSNRSLLMEAIQSVPDNDLFRYHLQAGRDQVLRMVEAIEKNPEDLEARMNLGHAFYQIGEYEKSAKLLRTVREKDPNMIYASLYLGYDLMEMGDLEAAENLLKEAVKKDPRQMRTIMQQVALIELLKRLEESPDNVGLLNGVAQFYNVKNEYKKSLEYTLKVLAIEPENQKALQSAVFSLRGLGDPEGVLEYGERYEKLDSKDLQLQFIMAEMYQMTERCELAIPYLERILKTDDTFRGAQKMLNSCKKPRSSA